MGVGWGLTGGFGDEGGGELVVGLGIGGGETGTGGGALAGGGERDTGGGDGVTRGACEATGCCAGGGCVDGGGAVEFVEGDTDELAIVEGEFASG